VTKYRRGVLTGEHLDALGEVFASVCADFGAELVELDGEDDHVHLLVAYPPQVAISRLVNSLKGVSARRLRARYPVRIHRGHLWSPSYFAASAGGAPLETLKQYIRQQRTPRRPGKPRRERRGLRPEERGHNLGEGRVAGGAAIGRDADIHCGAGGAG
jgi:putative transposase